MHILTMTLFALVIVAPAVAQAQVQVHVDIGIRLPAPPRLIVVPQCPSALRGGPRRPGNLFFYNGQYWAFASGGWYVSGGYNGPWVVVAPEFVPRPVLFVPVRYYHVPPGHWKKWPPSGPRTGRRTGDASGPTSASGRHGAGTATTTIATTIPARARREGSTGATGSPAAAG